MKKIKWDNEVEDDRPEETIIFAHGPDLDPQLTQHS